MIIKAAEKQQPPQLWYLFWAKLNLAI